MTTISPASAPPDPGISGYAIVELMGHRRVAGRVTEVKVLGKDFLRIDQPTGGGPELTQFYGPDAIYCLTPVTEDVAQALSARVHQAPVRPWELPSADRDDDPEDRHEPF